jgi:hypothetical protein
MNNVQLEGRRINVEISKMMVAEDVIITEEVQVVVLVVEEVLLKKRRKLHQEEKVQVADLDLTEALQEKVVLEEEVLLQRRWFWKKFRPRGEGGSEEHQDVLKAGDHLDQEDQEETNV